MSAYDVGGEYTRAEDPTTTNATTTTTTTDHSHFYRIAPHRTAPHRTAPHRTAPHRTDNKPETGDSPTPPPSSCRRRDLSVRLYLMHLALMLAADVPVVQHCSSSSRRCPTSGRDREAVSLHEPGRLVPPIGTPDAAMAAARPAESTQPTRR
ncbi:hypothetical protein CSOJ01_07837 [Colletotrichum sojae]|uniref:Uncharacterized protein n=1 Tax=Colletotrichum sojae TaxID=2175907 RepID=A0A8H6J7M2_9PEZI|nr:hypothetical protein CSOJ01_07837 [Colletotrichum sojae]